MIFLLSGEGPTDIGVCRSAALFCRGVDFAPGPMTLFIDRIVEHSWDYSILDNEGLRFVGEDQLVALADELKTARKSIRLPGVRMRKETRYFFNNARLLARMAIRLKRDEQDEVIAVLFRDSDGAASAGRGVWEDKCHSMLDGFREEGFKRGVPMIPKPKSEAWLLCALKERPYQNCEPLEDRSGNDDSPNSLKKELADILRKEIGRELLIQVFQERNVRFDRIDMPSFKAFLTALQGAMATGPAGDKPR